MNDSFLNYHDDIVCLYVCLIIVSFLYLIHDNNIILYIFVKFNKRSLACSLGPIPIKQGLKQGWDQGAKMVPYLLLAGTKPRFTGLQPLVAALS